MTDKIQSPGDVIKVELDKRGWTQYDLAAVLGKYQPEVNALIQSKRSVTPEVAVALAAALGNTPEFWMNLDSNYRVSLLPPNAEVERRAKLFGVAPIKDMQKRGWIDNATSIKELETEICAFFNISSIDEQPKVHVNARQPLKSDTLDASQIAWCVRGGRLAATVQAKKYKPENIDDGMAEMKQLAAFPETAKYLPKVLAEMGIRLVVIEPLPHSPIDGAAFWLDDGAPVILLSLRFDRIDCLWFTLAHECSHIRHRDAQSVDSDLVGESSARDLDEMERRANKEAAAYLIPREKLQSFIIRVKPFYSKERIIQFAHRMKIHPGIVAGQLQFHREIGWHTNREMLAKIRGQVIRTAMTDGWGTMLPKV